MFTSAKDWLKEKCNKQTAKTAGGATLSAGGILLVVFNLHADVSKKIEAQALAQKADVREYVALSLRPIEAEIKNVKDQTKETRDMVKEIRSILLNNRN